MLDSSWKSVNPFHIRMSFQDVWEILPIDAFVSNEDRDLRMSDSSLVSKIVGELNIGFRREVRDGLTDLLFFLFRAQDTDFKYWLHYNNNNGGNQNTAPIYSSTELIVRSRLIHSTRRAKGRRTQYIQRTKHDLG